MEIIRISGIALLAIAVLAISYSACSVSRDRLRFAGAFIALITRLRGLIEFNRGELSELYPVCSGGGTESLEKYGFLIDAKILGWNIALENIAGRIFIAKETLGVLQEFGDTLGKTDTEDQLRNCDRALSRLNEIIAINRPEQIRQQKLYRTLGISAALAIFVLLI